jgi:exopolyphosphatase/guanosine-5'-triphosphate,3'-diphosphate pyrophosphatase
MTVVAAIDCGTNSTRLLVRDRERIHERLMTITRLGEGVEGTGRLSPVAIERTVSTLRRYREVLERNGVRELRLTATSAARDAENRGELVDAIEEVTGARPELLTGAEEGRLAFLGATAGLDLSAAPVLVVDIGGGSTELVVGPDPARAPEPLAVRSIDLGCVRLTEKFLRGDPPRPEELTNALGVVRDHLEEAGRDVPEMGASQRLIGLAGTVTTVAAVEIGLARYDRARIHHFVLTRKAVEDVYRTLATEALADRVWNPGLERERADVIVGGTLILVAIMRHLNFGECLVSEDDLLDGLAMTLLTPNLRQ